MSTRQRVRIRVQVAESDPSVDSLTDIYPGVDAMEREAYDMLGIVFADHPDIPGSSCPRSGRVTRCARTTASVACRCSSRKRRGHDERP